VCAAVTLIFRKCTSEAVIFTCSYEMCKDSVNPFANPNPVNSHSIMWQYEPTVPWNLRMSCNKCILYLIDKVVRSGDLRCSGVVASSFLTSALDSGESSASRPSRFTPGKQPPVPTV
jgi:hypothetical protein